MTGRELILYILENGLEDDDIIDEKGNPAGMLTPEETAERFEVPIATIMAWLGTGKLESFYIGGTHYIPANAQNPNKWMTKTKQRVTGPVVSATPSDRLISAVEGMNNEA